MRLTAFTDYGLRALMRLAGEPTRVFTTEGETCDENGTKSLMEVSGVNMRLQW